MRLSGITLETEHFEDYLSFLTEVLELELSELTDLSMKLHLESTWIEIKKGQGPATQDGTLIELLLDPREYEALAQKISFFYYRRGPSRFLFVKRDDDLCQIVDPDGRAWRFARSAFTQTSISSSEAQARSF